MPNPKPGTFPYKIKWLIHYYALGTVTNESFKEDISSILHGFPMSSESAAVCICKYLLEKEKYGQLSIDDLRHIADLITEVDRWVGSIIKEWITETY